MYTPAALSPGSNKTGKRGSPFVNIWLIIVAFARLPFQSSKPPWKLLPATGVFKLNTLIWIFSVFALTNGNVAGAVAISLISEVALAANSVEPDTRVSILKRSELQYLVQCALLPFKIKSWVLKAVWIAAGIVKLFNSVEKAFKSSNILV